MPSRLLSTYPVLIKTAVLNKLLGPPEAAYPVPVRRELYVRRFLAVSDFFLDRVFASVSTQLMSGLPLYEGPLVVYCNHPSFWDPLICGHVLSRLFPGHSIYAPIDEQSLQRFWYFRGLGFFPLKLDSLSGLRTFLRVGEAVLKEVKNPCLVVTPEGRFTDPTERPIRLKRGLPKLLSGAFERDITILPLALDYRMGREARPHAWVAVGESWTLKAGTSANQRILHQTLEQRLERVMDWNSDRIREGRTSQNTLEANI